MVVAALILAEAPASAQADDRLGRALAAIGRDVRAVRETSGTFAQPPGLEIVLKPQSVLAGVCERDTLVLSGDRSRPGSAIDDPRSVTARAGFTGAPAPPAASDKTTGPYPDCASLPAQTAWVTAPSLSVYITSLRALERLAERQAGRDPTVTVSCQFMLGPCTDAQRRLAGVLPRMTEISADAVDGAISVVARGIDGPRLWQMRARVAPGGAAQVEMRYDPPPLS